MPKRNKIIISNNDQTNNCEIMKIKDLNDAKNHNKLSVDF